jgi:hypothetical protein
MEIWKDFNLTISVEDILRGEGTDPEIVRFRKPVLVTAATEALEIGSSKIHAIAAICEVRVTGHRHQRIDLEGGRMLTGPMVVQHLAGSEKVGAVICTIGRELEALAASQPDPILGLALDGLGNAAVTLVGQQVCERIGERTKTQGMTMSTPLSPGLPEWPVEIGQAQVFALTDPADANVQLTEGGMMIPKKSISFVVGIGQDVSQANPCDVCNLKETCRYRNT